MPDRPLGNAVAPALPGSADTPKQLPAAEFGCTNPRVHRGFNPVRHRNGSDVPSFAYQIDYSPVFLSLLQMGELQVSQLAPAHLSIRIGDPLTITTLSPLPAGKVGQSTAF
jgi:hypothetical protein